MPSSPPCLCGTSSSDPLHIVIRGRPLRASLWLAAGKQWEPKGSGAHRGDQANKQQQQHVSHSSRSGWDGLSPKRGGGEGENDTKLGPALPVRLFFFLCLLSTQCCSKLCTIVCLGRLRQGGAPGLVFVQPVGELLGPSDLSHQRLSHLLPL